MEPIAPEAAQDWLAWALAQYAEYPMLFTLIVMMGIDVATGLCAALIQGKLSSKLSYPGMLRKSAVLLIVGLAAAIERLQSDLPLAKLTALFFVVHEALSILENARKCGVPIPEFLSKSLDKMLAREGESEVVKTTTVTETTRQIVPAGEGDGGIGPAPVAPVQENVTDIHVRVAAPATETPIPPATEAASP